MPLVMYNHPKSSASYRVRIALNLKRLEFQKVNVDLLEGEQLTPAFVRVNPARLVPVLVDGDRIITQSLAIIDYLEDCHPSPPLLPTDPYRRSEVRAFALSIACDIHPLNNLRVLKYLTGPLGLDVEVKNGWYKHWIREGLGALETRMNQRAEQTPFCFSDEPGLADICLVPQLANARRTGCDLEPYPMLLGIEQRCMALEAFLRASPERSAVA